MVRAKGFWEQLKLPTIKPLFEYADVAENEVTSGRAAKRTRR
jgi:hypothetical protein